MSAGQVQIFTLARALLKLHVLNLSSSSMVLEQNRERIMPILLIYEVTSSLDPATEAIMRTIIHEEFTEKGHTIIAITHRMSGMEAYVRAGRDTIFHLSEGKLEKIDRVETDWGGDL